MPAWEVNVARSKCLAISCAILTIALLWPAEVQAQRRRAVRVAPARSVVVVGGYYHRPWFYDPWFGWGPPYGWYPPYAYVGRYDGSASLRLQVEPEETEVFIDGYFAGTVDDFNGFFQRLRLEPGDHEVELYLPGHRSVRHKIYLQPTGTFRLRHVMQPLALGDTPDPRPAPPASPPPGQRGPSPGPGGYGVPASAERPERGERAERETNFGALAIRVQPEEAEILIDGEAWEGPEAGERLVVELPEGEHRVEVRRDGYASYESTVRVRRGETATLNVSLVKE